MIYGTVFLVGYFLAMMVAAWERQGWVEAEVRSNAVGSVLRLGLGGELERLQDELSGTGPALEAMLAEAQHPIKPGSGAYDFLRSRLALASQRTAAIKERYANSPDDERALLHLLDMARREEAARRDPSRPADAVEKKSEPARSEPATAPTPAPSPPPPAAGGEPKRS